MRRFFARTPFERATSYDRKIDLSQFILKRLYESNTRMKIHFEIAQFVWFAFTLRNFTVFTALKQLGDSRHNWKFTLNCCGSLGLFLDSELLLSATFIFLGSCAIRTADENSFRTCTVPLARLYARYFYGSLLNSYAIRNVNENKINCRT